MIYIQLQILCIPLSSLRGSSAFKIKCWIYEYYIFLDSPWYVQLQILQYKAKVHIMKGSKQDFTTFVVVI